ncbi:MAG: divergent polysaccharide deacetylase family protein [Sulfuricurvum sp.]
MKKRSPTHYNIEKILRRIAWGLFFTVVIVISGSIGYLIGYNEVSRELIAERAQTTELIDQIRAITTVDEKPTLAKGELHHKNELARLKRELDKVLKQSREPQAPKAQHEYAPHDKEALPPPPHKREEHPVKGEGKLAIIIDDVSYSRDVQAIKSTGLVVTMSFLPPSNRHPESADLAKRERFYMVHLPLEALDYDSEEPNTLRIGDSIDTITKRIETLKSEYPSVRYMNNHTGSKFTSDSQSMDRLVRVLEQEGIQFVDSRTTAQTKVPEATGKYGMRYMGRDVFLDHQDGVENVKRQIKEAVEKSKKYGTAIAIGHPRPDTIKALQESKELLGEIKLVRIDQL